jgi:hypothetical protein
MAPAVTAGDRVPCEERAAGSSVSWENPIWGQVEAAPVDGRRAWGQDNAWGDVYVYEVFLSYRRGVIHSQWLVEHFVPLFKDRLREEIAEECNRDAGDLFLDVNEVQPGMSVGGKVVDGLKTARCLVALLSPSYFRSQWCLVEWDSFRTRSHSERRELVVPTILSQGTTVRRAVGDTMWADFSEYTIIGEGFRRTERYVAFQDEIKRLAKRVATVIANAPAWKDFSVCDPPVTAVAPAVPIQRIDL